MTARQRTLPAHLRRFAASYLVLAFGLGVTAGVYLLVSRAVQREREAALDVEIGETLDAVTGRMDTYLAALRGARGLFLDGRLPDRAAFRSLVASFELAHYYPGIQGVGFTLVLPPEAVASHEEAVRAEGFPHYRVWPEGQRGIYTSILFLEPFDWRNQRAFGFDMMSEPLRRTTMERARDTGQPAATGPVELVQEAGEERQPGFLIYVPVYRGAPATAEERRQLLVGFLYAPFRARDLLQGILEARPLDVEIRDAEGALDGGGVLYRAGARAARPDGPSQEVKVRIADREWVVRFAGAAALEARWHRWVPLWVAAVGVALSALLFATTHREIAAAVENARLYRQAQDAVRMRDEFLSIASHELKTPLTSLVLQADSLRKATRDAGDPLRKKVESVARNVDRLAKLVATLLDFSRLSSRRLDLHLEPVDLGGVAREVAERFADEVARAGCELRVDVRDTVVGRWDRLRLDQVITNLLANAVKYGAGRPIDVTVGDVDGVALLSVRDRGIGISSADQERIFERFERAVSERNYGGFGLGLWIVSQIVAALDGSIRVESRPGDGSTFVVELPRALAEARAEAPDVQPDERPRASSDAS